MSIAIWHDYLTARTSTHGYVEQKLHMPVPYFFYIYYYKKKVITILVPEYVINSHNNFSMY